MAPTFRLGTIPLHQFTAQPSFCCWSGVWTSAVFLLPNYCKRKLCCQCRIKSVTFAQSVHSEGQCICSVCELSRDPTEKPMMHVGVCASLIAHNVPQWESCSTTNIICQGGIVSCIFVSLNTVCSRENLAEFWLYFFIACLHLLWLCLWWARGSGQTNRLGYCLERCLVDSIAQTHTCYQFVFLGVFNFLVAAESHFGTYYTIMSLTKGLNESIKYNTPIGMKSCKHKT